MGESSPERREENRVGVMGRSSIKEMHSRCAQRREQSRGWGWGGRAGSQGSRGSEWKGRPLRPDPRSHHAEPSRPEGRASGGRWPQPLGPTPGIVARDRAKEPCDLRAPTSLAQGNLSIKTEMTGVGVSTCIREKNKTPRIHTHMQEGLNGCLKSEGPRESSSFQRNVITKCREIE